MPANPPARGGIYARRGRQEDGVKNRIQFDDDGYLDEVVTDGGAHLEALDADGRGGTCWFLECFRADGSSFAVWIDGRVTLYEERGGMEDG